MENFKSLSSCRMSLFLAHRALNELRFIISAKNKGNSTSNSDTIKFYSITLHYMLIMELTKLLEDKVKGEHRKKSHFASLYRLNDEVNNRHNPNETNVDHQNIEERLKKIRKSNFYEKLKDYRDKKFAHTDNDFSQEAFEIIGFSTDDIEDVSNLVTELEGIINDCLQMDGGGLNLYKINTTENFLNFQDGYKGFALSRYEEFQEWKQTNNS